jgi:hypothetical protein
LSKVEKNSNEKIFLFGPMKDEAENILKADWF